MRNRIQKELGELGIQVVGEAEDGALAVALAVLEQPELLVIEDRLPWVTPLEVVSEVHRFAPRTVVAVQLDDTSEAASLLDAGAAAVVGRSTRPGEFCECCVAALRTTA
jgi:DNA-binding NarL/FixJ family response regulator